MSQTAKQFQEKHGFDDQDMETIKQLKKVFNGTVVHVGPKDPNEVKTSRIQYNQVHKWGKNENMQP